MGARSFRQHATVFSLPLGFLETILGVRAPALIRGDLLRLLVFPQKSLIQQLFLKSQKQLQGLYWFFGIAAGKDLELEWGCYVFIVAAVVVVT
jgi:hypothetical protein